MELAPALGPVVGDLGAGHLDQRTSGRRAQRGQLGDLAGRAIDRELDDLGVDVDLLHPVRRQLEQLRQHQL